MTIGAITEWNHTFEATVPTGSKATGVGAYTVGTAYLAFVTQARTDTTEPSDVTVDGMGITGWTQLDNGYWDPTGASTRKTQAFLAVPTASSTGAVTVNYASDPATIDILVLAVPGANAVRQTIGASHSAPTGTLHSPITLATPGSSRNATIAYVAGNVSASSARLELDADAGGEHDWTSFTPRWYSSSPTGTWFAGYTLDSTSDLTPGWIHTAGTTSASYMIAIEAVATPETAGPGVMFGGVLNGSRDVVLPSELPFLIGAAVGVNPAYTATTHPEATEAFEADLGGRHLQIARRFDSGMPTDFTSAAAGNGSNDWAQDIGLRHRACSVKETTLNAGISQARFETLIATIPNDGFVTWLTAHHEPDNDHAAHDATWFLGMHANLHAAWVAQGSPSWVKLYVCFTTWPANNARAISFFPPANHIADYAMLLDPYEEARSLLSQCEYLVTEWKAAGGTAWGIAETGSTKTGSNASNWVHTSVQDVRSDPDAIMFCYWHNRVEPSGTIWYMTDPDMLQAYGEEMDLTAP